MLDCFSQHVSKVLIMVPNFLDRYDNPQGRKEMWDKHEHHHIGFSIAELSDHLAGFQVVDARGIYFENLTNKVRTLFEHLREQYPELVANDLTLLELFRRLYVLDERCASWVNGAEEAHGTLVYAEASSVHI